MKKHLLLSFLTLNFAFSALNTMAQTSIPAGNVSGTWNLAGSPYNIMGSIQIVDGTTLTIQPGVTVNFQGHYKLNVQGRLLAIGTVADTIVFTAANITNGWWGIRFDNTPTTNDTSKIVFCKLQYGKATGASPDDNGGAFYFNAFSKAIISNCCISNCVAYNNGGGIFCDNGSSPSITNSIISNNMTPIVHKFGAGIFCHNSSNPTILNNTISNNISHEVGGGIACFASSPIISNNTITNNNADLTAGGIFCYSSNPTISNNTISNNTAFNGGGIYCVNISNPTILNNTISNNTASNSGGGIYCSGSSPTFRNCIFWGNIANASGAQVFLEDEPSDPNFYYCDVLGGSTAFELNGTSYTGTYQNNIDADPLFISPSIGSGTGYNGVNADWSLQSNSPCINTGDPNGTYPATDKAGNPRVTVCRIDMGAYEYQDGIPLTAVISETQPILCYGDYATATVVAAGGSGIYTYLWSYGGQTTASRTGLVQGVYPVTVTETSYGCSVTTSITINQPASALSVTPSSNNPICTNNNGSAGIIAAGGTAPYHYLWSTGNNNTTDTISGRPAGTYSVTVTDTNGCTVSNSFTLVTQHPVLSLVPTIINPICINNNGSVSITANGGTAPYHYLWSTTNNNTSDTISNRLAGTYSVTVIDTNGCFISGAYTLVTQYPVLSLVPTITNPICTSNNGSASITANGGTAPYHYLWSTANNNTADSISGRPAGTYSVTVTDTNGCVVSAAYTLVTQFPSISLTPSTTNTSCTNNGSASITPNGGTAPYTYHWSNSSTNQGLVGIGSGTYTVTVTDHNGCFISDTLTIINSVAPSSIPICMVTVDSSSTKNVIVWEKPAGAPIDSFKVYREIASVYTHIGSVAYSALSEFTDNTSGINPNTTSYKYKLSVLDTCGNESALSAEHQTVHVQLGVAFPQGVNLSWNDYSGFTFPQYRILRDNLGNGNWHAIDSVSFGITTYTSTDVLPNARYIVEAKRPAPCVSTRQSTTRSSSKSNTASQATGINELFNSMSVTISPNPSNGKFTIQLSSIQLSNSKCEVKIHNILGEQIYISELKQRTANEIDLSDIPKGIYFVQISDEIKPLSNRKIIVQ